MKSLGFFSFLFLGVLESAEVVEKVEVEVDENFEQLAKELENASPLEVMDKALEKFGNDIAIAFRYYIFFYLVSYSIMI